MADKSKILRPFNVTIARSWLKRCERGYLRSFVRVPACWLTNNKGA